MRKNTVMKRHGAWPEDKGQFDTQPDGQAQKLEDLHLRSVGIETCANQLL